MDKRFALRLKLHKIVCSIVYQNALLQKSIHGSRLVEGYTLCENQACWHCWVIGPDDVIYDVGKSLNISYTYSDSIPEGSTEMKHEQIDNNKDLFKLYTEDIKKFWKDAPIKVKKFNALK